MNSFLTTCNRYECPPSLRTHKTEFCYSSRGSQIRRLLFRSIHEGPLPMLLFDIDKFIFIINIFLPDFNRNNDRHFFHPDPCRKKISGRLQTTRIFDNVFVLSLMRFTGQLLLPRLLQARSVLRALLPQTSPARTPVRTLLRSVHLLPFQPSEHR